MENKEKDGKCPICNGTNFSELRLSDYSVEIIKEEISGLDFEDNIEYFSLMCRSCENYLKVDNGGRLVKVNANDLISDVIRCIPYLINGLSDIGKEKIKKILKREIILNNLK